MIDLYTWTTPNGRKVSILLEELGVEYEAHAINITKDEQFAPEFLKIAPNNRIPAIVDRDTDTTLMESGAIMLYLAEKHGRFLPGGVDRWPAIEWLMWQMGGLGPMAGQAHHFLKYAPSMEPPNDLPYAKDRYRNEVNRLHGVLNKRLAQSEYVAGPEFTIADMAIWPWAHLWKRQEQDLSDKPHFARWIETVGSRPAVQRGRALHGELRKAEPDKSAQDLLFKR